MKINSFRKRYIVKKSIGVLIDLSIAAMVATVIMMTYFGVIPFFVATSACVASIIADRLIE